MVVGLGIMLCFLGLWLTSLGDHLPTGWVAFAPLKGNVNIATVGGLHPWVRLVIWLILTVLWTGASLGLLRESTRRDRGSTDPSESRA
jgi:hypothetical protein